MDDLTQTISNLVGILLGLVGVVGVVTSSTAPICTSPPPAPPTRWSGARPP